MLSLLCFLSQRPKANSQQRPSSFFSLSPVLPCSLALLFFCLPAFSQQTWERTYGGTGYDYGESVQQTQDGGYIVAGVYSSGQVYLVKTNAFGDTLWTRNYGGADSKFGYSVQQTTDGGYIVAGYTGFTNDFKVYLIKTDPSGDTLWSRKYGVAGGTEEGYSVQQTSDGGYIVAGITWSFGNMSQVYLVKTNASGDSLWTRVYGGIARDCGYSVQQTLDGGYIVAGFSSSFVNSGVYLVKTNSSGDTMWTRICGVAYGYSIQQTTDVGYIVAGVTWAFGDSAQVYLVKTNAMGDTLWTRTYGGAGNDFGYSVHQTQDGGYIVTGETTSFGNGYQVYLIKTNASGDTLWTRVYGGAGNDGGRSVQQTSDGGYIIAGETNSFGAGSYDVYLIKTDANGNVGVEVSPSHESRVTSYGVFPNPFTSFATVPGHEAERFNLYDISGRKVGTYRGDRIGAGLSAGVYFLKPESGVAIPFRIVKLR